MIHYLNTSLIWIASAIVLFSVLVIVLFRTGMVGTTRDEEGKLKRKQSAKGYIVITGVMLLFLGAMLLYDYSVFGKDDVSFWYILLFNSILVMTMVFYDSFIIDLLVIGKIRPKFLQLPDNMNMQSMKAHVIRQFTIGWIFVVPLMLIPTILFALLM